jgi:hypothetical protein
MSDISKPLIALGFTILMLLGLLVFDPSPIRFAALAGDSDSKVTELGLRFTLQR